MVVYNIVQGSLPQFTFSNYTQYEYIGISNDGNYLFLNNQTRIDIFSTADYTLINSISINSESRLRQPIFSKNGNYVYYVDIGLNAVLIIDAHLLKLVEVYYIPITPSGLYADILHTSVLTKPIFEVAQQTPSTTPLNGTAYFNGTLSSDNNYLFVYPASAYFYGIQLQNGLPTGQIHTYNSLSGYPLWYVGVGNNGLIYALGTNTANTESVISVIDPNTANIVNTITVYNNSSGSTQPDFIFFVPNSNTAYVRDSFNSNMYIIDTVNNTLVSTNADYWGYYTSTSDGAIVFSSGTENSVSNNSLNIITSTSVNPIVNITFGAMPTPYLPMVVDPTNTYVYTLYNVGYDCCVYDTPVLKIQISDYSFLDLKTYKWTVYVNKQENGTPVCGGTSDYVFSTDNSYSLSAKVPNGTYYYIVCPEPSFMRSYSGSFSVYYGNVTINVPLSYISCFC